MTKVHQQSAAAVILAKVHQQSAAAVILAKVHQQSAAAVIPPGTAETAATVKRFSAIRSAQNE